MASLTAEEAGSQYVPGTSRLPFSRECRYRRKSESSRNSIVVVICVVSDSSSFGSLVSIQE